MKFMTPITQAIMKTTIGLLLTLLTSLPAISQLTVTNAADSGTGSLRAVIASATGGETVTFDPSIDGETIELASEINITVNLTISGNDSTNTMLDGLSTNRIFNISSGVIVNINRLSIQNGSSEGNGAGIQNNGTLNLYACALHGHVGKFGGAIYNEGTLNINKSTLYANSHQGSGSKGSALYNTATGTAMIDSSEVFSNSGYESCTENAGSLTVKHSEFHHNTTNNGGGGGISNYASLYVMHSEFYNNFSPFEGGGIMSLDGPTAFEISDSKVYNNSGGYAGGGIFAQNYLKANRVLVQGNIVHSGDGGGIYTLDLFSSEFIKNAAITGNKADEKGAGIYISGNANLTNCTLVINKSFTGGGGIFKNNSGSMNLKNTVISDNYNDTDRSDIYSEGGINNLDFNALSVNTDVSGNFTEGMLVGTNAAPLNFDFISLPDTSALPTAAGNFEVQPTSKLIAAGDGTDITDTEDVAGSVRFVGTIDIGAWESIYNEAATYSVLGVSGTCTSPNTGSITLLGFGTSYALYDFSVVADTWQSDTLFSSLPPGNYSVKYRLKTNTSLSYTLEDFEITAYTPVSASLSVTHETCIQNDGTLSFINISGGTSPFEFSIDNGATWVSLSPFENLADGTYHALIREKNNTSCFTDLGTVNINAYTPLDADLSITAMDCSIPVKGSVSILNASGGSGQFQFSKDNGFTWVEETQSVFESLNPGTYPMVMRDKNLQSCTLYLGEATVSILNGPTLSKELTPPNCTTLALGEIAVSFENSNKFEFSINNGMSWTPDSVFSNLEAGLYQVLARDTTTGFCEVNTGNIDFLGSGGLAANLADGELDCETGQAFLNITNPTGGFSSSYEYSVNGTDFDPNPSVSTAGTYAVIMRQNNGACPTPLGEITISASPIDNISADYTLVQPYCSPGTGEIHITNLQGTTGNVGYGILPSGSDTLWSSNPDFTGLGGDNYVIAVVDSAYEACMVVIDTIQLLEFGESYDIVYVDKNVNGENDGQSWSSAFVNLQDAFDMAAVCPVKQIWVAKGTYYPTKAFEFTEMDLQNRNREFFVNNSANLEIYGGFTGVETDLAQRDFRANTTTLSADIQNNNILNDNVFRLLRVNSSQPVTFDGLHFENGYGISTSGVSYNGMLEFEQDSVTLSNCTVEGFRNQNTGHIIHLGTGHFSFFKPSSEIMVPPQTVLFMVQPALS